MRQQTASVIKGYVSLAVITITRTSNVINVMATGKNQTYMDTIKTTKTNVLPLEYPKHDCYERTQLWSAVMRTYPCPWHGLHKEKKEAFKRASRERGAKRRLFV